MFKRFKAMADIEVVDYIFVGGMLYVMLAYAVTWVQAVFF